ncbi:hypothetical protein [Nocardioides nematodiphilus]|uniref:hypothetical protein n=1 Tax=Nocardioides nematodiphilus TaxID=2849669 RepID=UPI001CD96546|nr:hypothetical protein [Nocardioides nematodiphilus]MCA1983398.1 hypothetical protein [Nocardioides nematodiphilus]
MSRPFFARGLAASAVAALAVTGLATPAHADAPLTVSLLSQLNGKASTRQDVVTTSTSLPFTLTAHASANAAVTFSYRPAGADDSAWATIGIPLGTSTDGYVSADWSGAPLGVYDLQVSATDGTTTVVDRRLNVQIDNVTDAVELANQYSGLPYFTQPYASAGETATYATVTGTTSATSGDVALSWWDAADGDFHGQTNAAVSQVTLKAGGPFGMPGFPPMPSVYGGSFSGVLDLDGFDVAPGAVVPVKAFRGTDDVQPLALASAAQAITGISVDFDGVAGAGITGHATVVDASGLPIPGVQVRRSADDSLVGYTDDAGTVPLTQTADSSASYYANANNDAAYFPEDGDRTVSVESPTFASMTSVEPYLADGTVFDRDEYTDGDLALQVYDQEGAAVGAGLTVPYAIYRSGATPPAPTIGITDADGRIVISAALSTPGSYTLAYGEVGSTETDNTDATFLAGDATLALSPASGTAASGGTITYTGTLAIGEEPLSGRAIDLSYAPDGTSDAGIGAGHTLTAHSTTGEDGTFTVTVQDPSAAAAGSAAETGTLTATTAMTPDSEDSTFAGNADATASATARFVAAPWVPPTDPQPPVTGGDPQPPVTGGDPQPPVTGGDPQPPATPDPQNTVQLTGSGRQDRTDRLRIVVSPDLAGRKVILRRLVHGHWRKAAVGRIDENGVLVLKVRDRNRAHRTTYKVTVLSGAHPTSNTVTVS